MDLHLHLSVAFRALDRKWGTPVDLETSGDSAPCLPAVVDTPTTTFSSEEYLNSIKRSRPKPYSRPEDYRKGKNNVKLNDSFADISVSRMTLNSSNTEITSKVQGTSICYTCESVTDNSTKDLEDALPEPFDMQPSLGDSKATLTSQDRRKRDNNSGLKALKETAVYIGKKLRKKMIH